MGERFGKYELLRRIGVGGMAEVFAARVFGAEGFVKELVIKRILPAYNEDPEFVQMFVNEARLAAKLQHTSIVQIFDFNHVDGVYYIAMEQVDGPDLRKVQQVALRRARQIPLALAIQVGVETLKGLHYAHNRIDEGVCLELVHRDISPHNLLMSYSGEVKIADFGIAKVAAMASGTRTGVVKGKLTYMSPEQLDGEAVDGRTDIFSLGVVLWELIAGRRLYQGGGSEAEIMSQVRRAQVPNLRTLQGQIDADLAQVISKMVAGNPSQRFGSAQEALADLSRFASVNHALQTAQYLRELIPQEADRQLKGQTAALVAPLGELAQKQITPAVRVGAANAATRTEHEVSDREDNEGWSASEPTALSKVADNEGAKKRIFVATKHVAVYAGLFAIALVTGGFAWQASKRNAAPAVAAARTSPAKKNTEPVAMNLLDNDPKGPARPGKTLWVNGVELVGKVPAILWQHDRAEKLQLKWTDASTAPQVPQPQPMTTTAQIVREPASTPRSEKRQWGKLDIIVSPWASVVVDRKSIGETPVKNRKIRAGRHAVRLINTQLKRNEKIWVTVEPGQTAVIRRQW